jgi:hypothetical protein
MARNMRPVTKYAQRATRVLFSGVHVRGSAPTDYSISKSRTMQFVDRAKQCVVTHFIRELITYYRRNRTATWRIQRAVSPRGRKYASSHNNKAALRSRNAEPNVSDNRFFVHSSSRCNRTADAVAQTRRTICEQTELRYPMRSITSFGSPQKHSGDLRKTYVRLSPTTCMIYCGVAHAMR